MSLDDDITLNKELKMRVHIDRTTNLENPRDTYDTINTYRAVEYRTQRAVEFTHRFGDGMRMCVWRALDALGEGVEKTMQQRIDALEEQVMMETPPAVEWQQVNELLRTYSLACSVTFTETGLDKITDEIMWLVKASDES
jgi:hypothetical protein